MHYQLLRPLRTRLSADPRQNGEAERLIRQCLAFMGAGVNLRRRPARSAATAPMTTTRMTARTEYRMVLMVFRDCPLTALEGFFNLAATALPLECLRFAEATDRTSFEALALLSWLTDLAGGA